MDIEQIKELLGKYMAGTCTETEKELIEDWYERLKETGQLQWSENEKRWIRQIMKSHIMNEISGKTKREGATVLQLSRKFWWAAAYVLLLIGVYSLFEFFRIEKTPVKIAKAITNDVKAPQTNRAMITLANGQKVFLDSVGSGSLAVQGNIKLVKLSTGEIVYQDASGEITNELKYNVLTNPRGSRVVNMVLSDGSRVWLNAGSSITYPVAFVGKDRKVEITGEAYFEVAHDVSKPFIVNYGDMEVKVLGTHFNVNTFRDDGSGIKVTLLEGSVKVEDGKASSLLKPGEQAKVSGGIKVEKEVNLDEVMAWKNGYFQFDHASLQAVLSQISRWYDVDVVYQGRNEPREFVGAIQRDLDLSEVLKILEKNKVRFKIVGKELVVFPDHAALQ